MKGKEEESFAKAKDNYSKMQAMICEGSRFQFRHDLSTRIIPRDIKPDVDVRHVDIPIENTQNTSLPEPKKSARRRRKNRPRRNSICQTALRPASLTASGALFGQSSVQAKSAKRKLGPVETDLIADVPGLLDVVLGDAQMAELNRLYRQYPSRNSTVEEISAPRLDAFPASQRLPAADSFCETQRLHERMGKTLAETGHFREFDDRISSPFEDIDNMKWKRLRVPPFDSVPGENQDRNGTSEVSRSFDPSSGNGNPSTPAKQTPTSLDQCI